jgi:cytochrome P450
MLEQDAPAPSLYRLLDPEVIADPYPLYRQLREEAPVHWDPYLHVWLVSRHRDAVEVLQRFSAQRAPSVDKLAGLGLGQLTPIAQLMAQQMLYMDPPQHSRLRALAASAFTPRRVDALRQHIQDVADTLLDDVVGRGEMDVMTQFAHRLPAIVMTRTFGTPDADYPRLKAWSEEFADVLGAIQHNPAAAIRMLSELENMTGYFREAVRRAPSSEASGLIAAIAEAELDGDKLTEDEAVANLILTLVGGYETTSHLIGSGLLTLLRHPDQMHRLRADPSLIDSAVEELLRFESPIQHTARLAPADTELGGRQIQAGQPVLALLGAANRDPEQFSNPEQLDIGRSENRHLAFGWSSHFCFGAALARIEGSIALRTLLQRLPEVRLVADEVEWRPNPAFRGPATLQVVFAA